IIWPIGLAEPAIPTAAFSRHTITPLSPNRHKCGPWQRATTRNGALWEKDGRLGVFGSATPPPRQIRNWHGVVFFPGNHVVLGLVPALWRAANVSRTRRARTKTAKIWSC